MGREQAGIGLARFIVRFAFVERLPTKESLPLLPGPPDGQQPWSKRSPSFVLC